MGFDIASSLGGLLKDLPSQNDIANQILTGAVASVFIAGAKSDEGKNTLDPLHLFHKDGSSTVIGKTMPASVFNALDAAGKTAVMTSGYVIVAG